MGIREDREGVGDLGEMVCVAWGCVGMRINFGCECMHVACLLDVALILACVCGYSVLCCSHTF